MVIGHAAPHGERRAEAVIPPVLGAIGLVAIVIGTFLPWLRSGTQDRNSYQAGGAVAVLRIEAREDLEMARQARPLLG
jgi:hypothetical protein